jgi:Kef-type K+ transport system membrane component KefB
MVLGSAGLLWIVREAGRTLSAPASPALKVTTLAATPASHVFLHVLLALAAVVVAGQMLRPLLGAIGQPPVIGELLGGIALGPSLLGRIAPHLSTFILPPGAAPTLGLVANLGVVLYMFLVGLELNGELLEDKGPATLMTAHASIAAPFVLGSGLALYLFPRLATSDVPFTHFALFLGVAMSITAFPVLARILTDRGMTRTHLGAIALTCAAAGDVTAWCLLAAVVGVTKGTLQAAAWTVALTSIFVAAMFLVVRPVIARRLASTANGASPAAIALALAGLLVSALVTDWVGVHAIFGAFLCGAIIPHTSALAEVLTRRLERAVSVVLLPAFFAFTGMRTEIGLVSGTSLWMVCALIIGVATVGKVGGTVAAAKLTGMQWRDAVSLGVLMNTRGLMEIIVLTVGLDMGIISPTLFAMMVLMALATTMMTAPALTLLQLDGAG